MRIVACCDRPLCPSKYSVPSTGTTPRMRALDATPNRNEAEPTNCQKRPPQRQYAARPLGVHLRVPVFIPSRTEADEDLTIS